MVVASPTLHLTWGSRCGSPHLLFWWKVAGDGGFPELDNKIQKSLFIRSMSRQGQSQDHGKIFFSPSSWWKFKKPYTFFLDFDMLQKINWHQCSNELLIELRLETRLNFKTLHKVSTADLWFLVWMCHFWFFKLFKKILIIYYIIRKPFTFAKPFCTCFVVRQLHRIVPYFLFFKDVNVLYRSCVPM